MGRSALWFPNGVDLDGDPVILDDGSPGPLFVMKGVTGIEAPPWTVTLTQTPGIPGGRFQHAVQEVRTIRMPIHLAAKSRAEMRALKSDLVAAMNPSAGPGVLWLADSVGQDSGDVRCISAVYNGGLEGNEEAIRVGEGATWWEFTLEFLGLDDWYSPDPATAAWSGFSSPDTFPIAWPLVFAPYGVQLTKLLDLPGTVESYGTYVLSAPDPDTGVTGPWSRVRFTNDRTLQCWELQRELSSETIVVNTRPGAPTPVANLAGESRYGLLTFRDFFPIAPHTPTRPCDTISVQVDGATDLTLLTLEVPPAWLTAP